jgi:hypothetical protein
MLFTGSEAVPANTVALSPVEYTIGLTKGTITRVQVYFPWGCAGLVGVQVLRYTWQLFPQSRGEWLIGNDAMWEDNGRYPLDTEPFEVLVRVYNLDDSYEHAPIVAVEISDAAVSAGLQQFLEVVGG